MAHYQQLTFVERTLAFFGVQDHPEAAVLEVGSYDVNGSIRGLVNASDYTGVDLTEGPGVDVVGSGHEVDFGDDHFDLALSCEVFEHNPYWKETFENMVRMTKPGGLVLFTCASTGRLEHGTTRTDPHDSPGTQAVSWNYYLNLTETDFGYFPFEQHFSVHQFFFNPISKDLYFVGRKAGEGALLGRDWDHAALSAFTADAFRVDPASIASQGRAKRVLGSLYRLPVEVSAHFLSDESFQNVQLAYFSGTASLKELGKRAVKLLG